MDWEQKYEQLLFKYDSLKLSYGQLQIEYNRMKSERDALMKSKMEDLKYLEEISKQLGY